MDTFPVETRAVITEVLRLEESPPVDWTAVGYLCDSEIERINKSGLGAIVNGVPYQFLEDYDIRRRDYHYAEKQRERIKNLLSQ
jgi:hypothetical protein